MERSGPRSFWVAHAMYGRRRDTPLAQLRNRLDMLPTDKPIVVHCAGGWRSVWPASLLRAHGFDEVSDLAGGYNAWLHAHAIAQHTAQQSI
jgi:rhodanese-related sulfurtransferase